MTQIQIEKATLLVNEGFEVLARVKYELDIISATLNQNKQQILLNAA